MALIVIPGFSLSGISLIAFVIHISLVFHEMTTKTLHNQSLKMIKICIFDEVTDIKRIERLF